MNDSERPSGLDELNVVQLNLIAALDQVTSSHWKVVMVRQGRHIQVECEALERYGVPHGLDNDVASALISEYAIAGMPEDGRLTLSATQLLRASGFSLTGLYYTSLHDSLRRLATTTYTVSEGGWRDADRRWTHASFHFLEDLEVSTKDGARLFDERTIIRLRLADKITASIRSGFTKPLDVDFMLSLSRPRARVLYRVLDAARYDLDTGEYLQHLTLGLEELVALCKLTSSRPDNVARSLESVHAELKKKGYLQEVVITGRGLQRQFHYRFVPEFRPVDPVVTFRLKQYGVTGGAARDLATHHPREWLIAQMDRFDHLVRTQVIVVKKTPAAALVHLLKNPDHYPYPKSPQTATAPATRKAARMEPLLEAPAVEDLFDIASLEEAAERLLTYLSPHYRKLLSAADLDRLRHAVMTGRLEASAVAREGLAAVTRLDRPAFVSTLREHLNEASGEGSLMVPGRR